MSSSDKYPGIIDKLINEICKAEIKHPVPSFEALVEEVGEVAKAIQEQGAVEYRAELLQVACVAVRLIHESHKAEGKNDGANDRSNSLVRAGLSHRKN